MNKIKNEILDQVVESENSHSLSLGNPEIDTQDESFPLLDIFWEKKLLVLGFVFVGFLVAMLMAISSPKLYQARASFFALEGSRWSRNSSPIDNTNNMGSFIQNTTSAKKDIARQLLLIIYSRSLAKKVIDEMPELCEHFLPGVPKTATLYKDRLAQIVRRVVFVDLTNHTKPPILVVNMTNPELAIKTANKYLEVLKKYIQENSLNQETKNRVYLEKQAKNYELELKKAEEDLRGFEMENKLVSIDVQAKTALDILQSLKSDIIQRQRKLEILKASKMASKQDLRSIKEEIAAIEKQIDFHERGTNAESAVNNEKYSQIIAGGVAAIPDLVIKHKRLKRNRDNFAKVHSMLIDKLELAKLKEQMKPTSFFILDPAVTASQIAPRVRLQSIYGGIVGFFSAMLYLLAITLFYPVTNKR